MRCPAGAIVCNASSRDRPDAAGSPLLPARERVLDQWSGNACPTSCRQWARAHSAFCIESRPDRPDSQPESRGTAWSSRAAAARPPGRTARSARGHGSGWPPGRCAGEAALTRQAKQASDVSGCWGKTLGHRRQPQLARFRREPSSTGANPSAPLPCRSGGGSLRSGCRCPQGYDYLSGGETPTCRGRPGRAWRGFCRAFAEAVSESGGPRASAPKGRENFP